MILNTATEEIPIFQSLYNLKYMYQLQTSLSLTKRFKCEIPELCKAGVQTLYGANWLSAK